MQLIIFLLWFHDREIWFYVPYIEILKNSKIRGILVEINIIPYYTFAATLSRCLPWIFRCIKHSFQGKTPQMRSLRCRNELKIGHHLNFHPKHILLVDKKLRLRKIWIRSITRERSNIHWLTIFKKYIRDFPKGIEGCFLNHAPSLCLDERVTMVTKPAI